MMYRVSFDFLHNPKLKSKNSKIKMDTFQFFTFTF
jgi:hypothetical protein